MFYTVNIHIHWQLEVIAARHSCLGVIGAMALAGAPSSASDASSPNSLITHGSLHCPLNRSDNQLAIRHMNSAPISHTVWEPLATVQHQAGACLVGIPLAVTNNTRYESGEEVLVNIVVEGKYFLHSTIQFTPLQVPFNTKEYQIWSFARGLGCYCGLRICSITIIYVWLNLMFVREKGDVGSDRNPQLSGAYPHKQPHPTQIKASANMGKTP
ncbi:hypothetical protein BKA70DRAFT_1409845 [Coprinopsis sp. MPI-PUGE-AT-0042]|nr:hypothetical protein BKA70DRAFT_1409845 [Coprinopsis sp. MPI-PUGE-AT-0042]